MAVDQLPGRVREFVNYLNGLLAHLDQGGGWCAVFWQRDPDGMRACLDGREVPPWDVIEALLQDLATVYGPDAAAREVQRARPLHAAAIAAYDGRPGGRDALGDRLDAMLREQRQATRRRLELGRLLTSAGTRQEAEALRLDLAWARDDHERATARCAELRSRIDELDRHAPPGPAPGPEFGRASRVAPGPAADPDSWHAAADPNSRRASRLAPGPAPAPDSRRAPRAAYAQSTPPEAAPPQAAPPEPAPPEPLRPEPVPPEPAPPQTAPGPPPPTPKQRKRRRGSARFAGMAEEEAAPVVVPPTAGPVLPAPDAGGRTPRGARFAGAAAEAPARPEPPAETVDAAGAREVAGAVAGLVRLRAEGRSGEAHVLLAEAAHWPAARLPLLAEELRRAGLGADWATLLWEAASLPAGRLVAAADALVAAGRGADGEQILRQGVARPAGEIGQAVLELAEQGRNREVRALLDAYVRVRTPEEAARSAEPGPVALVPLLLEAAQGVSEERHWDLVHALRVAGFAT
ncbi:hypothetical protein ACIBL8_01970 [Streptomyces sp. NPDC050523]|uniref:hypothetical protein n=1 Tax=Streptomyces sp. NPDC050523 TaxID=3365622 RepID=UPI0037B6B288